ncbi:hypothetical protein Tco_0288491, partial [Tanacetum coccineum]
NPTGRVGQAAHLAAAQSNHASWSKRPAPVFAGRPVSAGWLNPADRPYFRPSSVYSNNKTNFYDPMFMYKGRWDTAVKTSAGNKEKLDDFVQIKGGIVKFGGGDDRISGKGTIRTSKLDFEKQQMRVDPCTHQKTDPILQIMKKLMEDLLPLEEIPKEG